jgi:biopolymer transport protein ExbD
VAERPQDPLWLTFTADRALLLDTDPVDTATLAAALDARTGGNRDTAVYLRADRSVDYGALMGVLDALRNAGYLKVALVGLEGAP